MKTQYQLSGDLYLAAFIELTGTAFFFSKSFRKELAKTSLGSFEKSNDEDFKWIKHEAALQDENNTMGDIKKNLKVKLTSAESKIWTAAPIPATAGIVTYYVAQNNDCGESPRTMIKVTVTATPSLAAGLTVSALTVSTATISWNVTSGLYYSVQYKPVKEAIWRNAVTNVLSGTFVLSQLTAATVYDWRVSVNCIASVICNFSTSQFTTASGNNSIANVRNGFGLKIFPNPLAGAALIDYIVPGNGVVDISLINPLSQRLQLFFSGNQSKGQYQLILPHQLGSLLPGNYFIRLEQNGQVSSVSFFKQ